MTDKLKELIANYCEDVDGITEETELSSDIGMSSMDYYMFINDIEEEYDIQISDDEIKEMLTVGDLLNCIESKKA